MGRSATHAASVAPTLQTCTGRPCAGPAGGPGLSRKSTLQSRSPSTEQRPCWRVCCVGCCRQRYGGASCGASCGARAYYRARTFLFGTIAFPLNGGRDDASAQAKADRFDSCLPSERQHARRRRRPSPPKAQTEAIGTRLGARERRVGCAEPEHPEGHVDRVARVVEVRAARDAQHGVAPEEARLVERWDLEKMTALVRAEMSDLRELILKTSK